MQTKNKNNRAAAPVNRDQAINQPAQQRPAIQNRDNEPVNNRAYEEKIKENKTK